MSPLSDAMIEALKLLGGAGTWHELRRSLGDRKLDQMLSPAEMQDLLTAWHERRAAELDDDTLVSELAFWADGGTFETHLEGWQAVDPAALIDAAKHRGWFVRQLPGGAIVNPPTRKPLVLRNLAALAGKP